MLEYRLIQGQHLFSAFGPGPDAGAGDPVPFDPVADAVGGAADAAASQGPAPAPDPVAAPTAPDPGPALLDRIRVMFRHHPMIQ